MKPQDSQIKWQGASWRLRADRYVLPDGTQFEKGVIEHPGAVVLVPLRPLADQPELLMLQQYRHSVQDDLLELPAGTRQVGESWLACAQRELREETGFRAESFVLLGEMLLAPGYSNERLHVYLALGLTPDELPPDADETITVRPMPFAEAWQMAQDGRLLDAKTIVALLWTAVYLQTHPNDWPSPQS